VLNLAQTLSSVLEEEFVVLESKNLELLEAIQDRKVTLLQHLDLAWANLNSRSNLDQEELTEPISQNPLWEEAFGLINSCKDAHIRNDLLLKKQLEVVRNVLSAITKKSQSNHGDLYDKMGRIGKKALNISSLPRAFDLTTNKPKIIKQQRSCKAPLEFLLQALNTIESPQERGPLPHAPRDFEPLELYPKPTLLYL